MGPECQCGCGETLPMGSTRNYKRGHKPKDGESTPRALHSVTPSSEWTTVNPEQFPEPGDWEGLRSVPLSEDEPLTFERAAAMTPDDAPPADFGKPIKPKFKVSKAVQNDVNAKTTFYLSLGTSMLMPLDPICFGAMQENAPNIAAKLTPILCQSPDIVKWMTKAGNFALYADLAMAMWPVVQVIIAHHISKTIAVKGRAPEVDYSAYSAAA